MERIAGIDEAGRGPLAGPVVAACCLLPSQFKLKGINDSKQLTPSQREKLFEALTSNPDVHYGIAAVDVDTIDEINILRATLFAMQKAALLLTVEPDYFLVDGNQLPILPKPAKAIVDGDALFLPIAAASILAKVARDRMMENLHLQYPQYNFYRHKGYATAEHIQAIFDHGPSALHRKSFDPVRSMISQPTLF